MLFIFHTEGKKEHERERERREGEEEREVGIDGGKENPILI